MIINFVSSTPKPIRYPKLQNHQTINFGQQKVTTDSCSFKTKPTPVFVNNASKKENEVYKNFLNSGIKSDNCYEISSNSKVYKIGQENSSLIVKVKHEAPGIEKGVVKQISKDFENEVKILSSLPKSFKNKLNLIGYSTLNNSVNSIATEFIDGHKPDAHLKNLDKKTLSMLYADFLQLDKANIYHRDLTTYNILINKNNVAKIVDYGASKTFKEMEDLSNSGEIKFKQPDFLACSNLQNFEENALLVYLKQLQNIDRASSKEADALFEEHIKLKADYYDKHSKTILNNKENEEKIKNDIILRDAYNLFKANVLDKETKTYLLNSEKLRIKMNHAQKRVRLYNDNTLKNPITALYWNMLEGSYTKGLIEMSKMCADKYKNNDILHKYFTLQNKLAEFHYREIFVPEFIKHESKMKDFLLTENVENINTILQEGNLLDKTDIDGNWCGPCISIYKANINPLDDKNDNYKF